MKKKSAIKLNPMWEKKGNTYLMKDKYWKDLMNLQFGKQYKHNVQDDWQLLSLFLGITFGTFLIGIVLLVIFII